MSLKLRYLNLRGLHVAHSHQSLLDIEFVDDTVVYMQGDLENLQKLESGLIVVFCKKSNVMIN